MKKDEKPVDPPPIIVSPSSICLVVFTTSKGRVMVLATVPAAAPLKKLIRNASWPSSIFFSNNFFVPS